MSDKKTVVILGATGTQGGSVTEVFLNDPSWTVRAVTRNTKSTKAQALQARGAELVEADLNNYVSLKRAFRGAHAIFSVTDFWTIYANQSFRSKLPPEESMMTFAYHMEMQQGKNVFDAASGIETLERLVFSTLADVTKLSGGKYTGAYHLDCKAAAVKYGREKYPGLWAKTSLVQLGFYLTNTLQTPWLIPRKNKDTGVYEISDQLPDVPRPMIATEKDTGPVVKTLVSADPGKHVGIYREQLSLKQFMELWGHVLGVEATANDKTAGVVPDEMNEELTEVFCFGRDFGLFGEEIDESIISPRELDPSIDLGTVEDWIRKQDWSSVLQGE